MRFPFHKFILAPTIMAAAALATNTAKAETTLNVPFNFTVNGKSWPAGTYAVAKDSNGNRVTLFSKDSSKISAWIIVPGNADPRDTRIILTFDSIGDTHSLFSIQYGSKITPNLGKARGQMEYLTAGASHGR